jgi:predicted O-methyltransferase YrrM
VQAPPLVRRALELAERLGYDRSCSPETGALLHVLAAAAGRRRVGELGTGVGVGAAWIVSALDPRVPFVTVEADRGFAAAAAGLFATDRHVRVLNGGWRELLPAEAPFDLVFVDVADAKADVEAVLGLLAPGGLVVLDDFTPGRPEPDPRRAAWLTHPELAAVELHTTAATAAVVAARRL